MILVLSPTRELALQIAQEAMSLTKFHRMSVVTLVGEDFFSLYTVKFFDTFVYFKLILINF